MKLEKMIKKIKAKQIQVQVKSLTVNYLDIDLDSKVWKKDVKSIKVVDGTAILKM